MFILPWFIVLMCLPDKMSNNKYADDRVGAAARPSVTEEILTASHSQCVSCDKMRLPGQTYCAGCGAKLDED